MSQLHNRSYASVCKQIKTAKHAFQLLGVHVGSTDKEISSAWRALIWYVHPDRNSAPEAQKLAADVNMARDMLLNNRKRYLAELGGARCAVCNGAGHTTKQKGFTKTMKTPCAICSGAGIITRRKDGA